MLALATADTAKRPLLLKKLGADTVRRREGEGGVLDWPATPARAACRVRQDRLKGTRPG